jgi:hypothetical protein
VNYTTQADLVAHSNIDPYWKAWEVRWAYMAVVQDWMRELDPQRVLEAGTNGVGVCADSDTMGLEDECTFTHDLTQIMWPFENKEYDVFVALQVWEHLEGWKLEAFHEARRIAKHVILSFPYMWYCPGNIHHGIDDRVISEWTGGIPPIQQSVVTSGGPGKTKRIVCHWNGV